MGAQSVERRERGRGKSGGGEGERSAGRRDGRRYVSGASGREGARGAMTDPVCGHVAAEMPTHEEMMANKLDVNVRDNCAHLLIPLNKCRIATHFAMWKCDHERHEYEKCQ